MRSPNPSTVYCTENHVKANMTYREYYSNKEIPKVHSKGLGIPKCFAGGTRASTIPFFKRLKRQGKVPPKMKYEEWSKIVNLTNQKLTDTVLTNEIGVRLPAGLGILRIMGRKCNEPVVLFNGDKRILTNNVHTFGYIYSMRWLKGVEVRMKFKDIYHFSTTRAIKKAMCVMIESEFPYIKNRSYETYRQQ